MSDEQRPTTDTTRRQLIGDLASGRLSRRDFMMRAAGLGLSASAIGAFLAACGGGATATTAIGARPPLGSAEHRRLDCAKHGGFCCTEHGCFRCTDRRGNPCGYRIDRAKLGELPAPPPVHRNHVRAPQHRTGGAYQYTLQSPPPVPNAAQAKQYSGAKLTYYADASGIGNQLDVALAQKFTQDTGIAVNVVGKPTSATETYSTYQRFFQAQSADLDVMMIDVIWPAAFAPNLLDLDAKLGDQAKKAIPSIIAEQYRRWETRRLPLLR